MTITLSIILTIGIIINATQAKDVAVVEVAVMLIRIIMIITLVTTPMVIILTITVVISSRGPLP